MKAQRIPKLPKEKDSQFAKRKYRHIKYEDGIGKKAYKVTKKNQKKKHIKFKQCNS